MPKSLQSCRKRSKLLDRHLRLVCLLYRIKAMMTAVVLPAYIVSADSVAHHVYLENYVIDTLPTTCLSQCHVLRSTLRFKVAPV